LSFIVLFFLAIAPMAQGGVGLKGTQRRFQHSGQFNFVTFGESCRGIVAALIYPTKKGPQM
jgi:hypothetical protein